MAQTYLYGYGSGPYGASTTRRDRAYIEAQAQFSKIHPELRDRLFKLADAVIAVGSDYGFGGGWRSSETQLNLFLSRYTKVAQGTPGSFYWDGKPNWTKYAGYWLHTSGASAAPPGRSYHESTTANGTGFALAVDMLGDHATGNKLAAAQGLKHFANVNQEPWHYQPVEIANARRDYNPATFEPAPDWGADPQPQPEPDPGDDEMDPIKPTRVYDSRADGLAPFAPGESRKIGVVMGQEAHIAGAVQILKGGADGWWGYNTEDVWDKPTSFVNPYATPVGADGNGRWTNFSIPVLAPGGHIWIKSTTGGHIYIDTYAAG